VRRVALLSLLALLPLRADDHWTGFHTVSGPFQVYSAAGDKQARTVLNELEQLRWALGSALAVPDMQLVRPMHFLIFRHNDQFPPLASPAFGRDAWMVGLDEKTLLTPALKAEVARRLLDENTHKMPDAIDTGLVELYSTIGVNGTRITVGEPVPHPTPGWALLQMLITDENTAGEMHIFLSNLAHGGDLEVACRNAFRIKYDELQKRLTAYLNAGHFVARMFGGAAIDPDRDFRGMHLDSSDGKLLLGDYLLAEGSPKAAEYYLDSKHGMETEEGLGLAAAAKGDRGPAIKHLAAAIAQNTKNPRVWYEAGMLESTPEKKRADLIKAAELNPKWSDPLVRLAETEPGPVRRAFWLKKAAEASPRDIALWKALAKAATEAEQFQDAARAWAMAENAAGTDEERQQVRDERLQAEQARLDAADAERKREDDERRQDLERVRQASLAAIRSAEARANKEMNPNGEFSKEGAVDYSELEQGGASVDGALERFDCLEKQARLVIRTARGTLVRLLIVDPTQIAIQGSESALACGVQKPARQVHVSYEKKTNAKTGTSGEVRAIAFAKQP
jgi:hypothetical protein